MKNLNITVVNKVATYCQRDGFIVCGNSDYQITFTFDEEWSEYTGKIARFKWNGGHRDVGIVNNVAAVPIIENATQVEVGVYVDDISTTTPALIRCIPSILCGSSNPYISQAEAQSMAEEIERLKPLVGDMQKLMALIVALEEDKLDANGWRAEAMSLVYNTPGYYVKYGVDYINFSSDTTNSGGKFTFPGKSGTIALTSDLDPILARLTALENK